MNKIYQIAYISVAHEQHPFVLHLVQNNKKTFVWVPGNMWSFHADHIPSSKFRSIDQAIKHLKKIYGQDLLYEIRIEEVK